MADMTNYERIKNMSIDEMASFFDNIQTYDLRYPNDFDDWKEYLEREVSGMTNEEAIKTIKHGCIYRDARGGTALEIAVEALEKQIAKKPKRVDKNSVFDGNWKMICPCCGATLVERITTEDTSYPIQYNMTKHCTCGQALDWSDS